MVLFSKKLELLALYTICQGDKYEKVSSYFSANLIPEHFHYPPAKEAFRRVTHLMRSKGENVDWALLLEDPTLDSDTRDILSQYEPTIQVTQKKMKGIFNKLESYRAARILYEGADSIIKMLSDDKFDVDALTDKMADTAAKARVSDDQTPVYHLGKGMNASDVVKRMFDMSIKPLVVKTGFKSYDDVNGGFPDHGLVILAATTSSGKSAVSNQLALNMHDSGWDVAKVSLEMTEEQEFQRMAANRTGIPLEKFIKKTMTPKEVKIGMRAVIDLVEASKQSGKRLSVYCPVEDVTLTNILMMLKPYRHKVIIIDYITLLKPSSGKEQWQELSELAREAKRYSTNMGCLVIMLAQLDDDNRIRYSRAIKEHADIVWTWALTDADREAGRFTIHHTKGRNQVLMNFEVESHFDVMKVIDAGTYSKVDKGNNADGDEEDSVEESDESTLSDLTG